MEQTFPVLPEIPDNYCAFHSAQEISRNGESFRANGKRLVYFFAYKPFQQKVHFHTKAGKKYTNKRENRKQVP